MRYVRLLPKDASLQLHIEAGHKLRTYTYALFKGKPRLESYLIVVKDVRQRQLVSMLRMGVLPLRIETGRYEACKVVGSKGVPVEFRVCKCCSLCKVEDEIHFLFECPLYSSLRVGLFEVCKKEIGEKFVGAWQKKDMEMCMRCVFSCQCKSVCQVLATYVFDAFKCRVRYLKLKPA